MLRLKAAIAFAGVLLLLWYWLAEQRPALRPGGRLRDALLLTLGVIACASWWNLGRFHFGSSILHYREMFHYYLGAKYAPELGYTRLYECSFVAEAEFAHLGARLVPLKIRDLATNQVGFGAPVLEHPGNCKQHFSPERWQAFMRDSNYFWEGASWERWPNVFLDHGYNATPAWRVFGGFLANRIQEANDASLGRLTLLDPLLLATMMGAVAWAFGWRTLCVALLFFGTNYPGRFWWTGGGFLRTDWLAATVCSICLLRRDRLFGAGLLSGFAAMMRIFPALFAAALCLKVLVASVRARRLTWTPSQRRFLAGALVAVAALLGLSVRDGGIDAWRGFVANSSKHLGTPLTNNMGLKTVLAYRPSTRLEVARDDTSADSFERWKQLQLENFHARRWLFVAGLLAFLVLLSAAVELHGDWVALVLGAGLVIIATQLTCYYAAGFIAFALLWKTLPWTGWALALLSFMTCVAALGLPDTDSLYVLLSAAYVVFAVIVTAALARRRLDAPAEVIPE